MSELQSKDNRLDQRRGAAHYRGEGASRANWKLLEERVNADQESESKKKKKKKSRKQKVHQRPNAESMDGYRGERF